MLSYYPNSTFTERIFDENGLLSITHKRMEPAAPANPNGTETVPESFTYAYNNATGNITRITTASDEYTEYTCDFPDRLTCRKRRLLQMILRDHKQQICRTVGINTILRDVYGGQCSGNWPITTFSQFKLIEE